MASLIVFGTMLSTHLLAVQRACAGFNTAYLASFFHIVRECIGNPCGP
jgi:hypothetical protein